MTTNRPELLQCIADAILRTPTPFVTRVGIDGVDGAGKTMFGDEITGMLQAAGRHVIRASVDSFHHPRALRYRQGRHSPQGFFQDSYDYAQLQAVLLDPLSPGGDGRYRTASFDHRADAPLDVPPAEAAPGDILVFDGIFLHRPELRSFWDVSVFLEVSVAVSVQRCAARDGGVADPQAAAWRRYIEGQQIYLRTCMPQRRATFVINNDTLDAPVIVAPSSA